MNLRLLREFAPAAQGELLVVVARFHRSTGAIDSEAHVEIARALKEAAARLDIRNRFRVEISSQELAGDAIAPARNLGRRNRASLVIWGADTGVRVTVNLFDLLNDRPGPTTITNTQNVSVHNPQAYSSYVTDSLPAELTSLALGSIASLRYAEGAFGEAASLSREALAAFPRGKAQPPGVVYLLVASLTQKGRDTYLNGDYGTALRAFDEALRATDPNWKAGLATGYRNRALALTQLGQLDSAIADLNEAIRLGPTAGAHLSRGWAYGKAGLADRARADYDKAVELDPKSTDARLLRGYFLKAQGLRDEAMADCEFVLGQEPRNGQAQQCRGDLFAAQGDTQAAQRAWDLASASCGELCDYLNRGSDAMASRRFETALREFDAAIAIRPSDWRGFYGRGGALLGLGRPGEARVAYARAADLQPGDARPQAGLGRASLELERYQEAVLQFGTALTLRPGNPCYLELRALAHEGMGDAAKAKADRLAAEQSRETTDPAEQAEGHRGC